MIKKAKDYIVEEIGLTPFVFSTLYTAKAVGLPLWPKDMVAYAALIVFSIFLLTKATKFNNLLLAFVIYLPVSILIDQPDSFFQPWPRFFLFLLLLICVSPLISSDYARKFRSGVFKMTLIYCIILSVVSFLCYFVGINMMRSSVSDVEFGYLINNAGTFSGITPQSMLLAPIAGIATIVCSYFAIKGKNRTIWICLSVACCGSLMFAASRSSLIATIVGEICLVCFFSRHRGKTIKYVTAALIVGSLTFPMWQGALDGINSKNMGDITQGINTNSREDKWDARIAEFHDSPLTGIGFVSVSSRDYHGPNGIIEPGSSWLAVLSMTGIIGFAIFVMIFYSALKNSLFTTTPRGAVRGAVLVLLGVHMIAEGHVFSAGSFLCFCVWLAIGSCTDYKYFLKDEKYNK